MKPAINSKLLELIEAEISETTQRNYYKNISIQEYNLATKLTLDYLVEKYGGFIYRYDNRITLLINFSHLAPKHQEKVNRKLYSKMTELEQKIDQVYQLISQFNDKQQQNYFSYMNYFEQVEDIKHDSKQLQQLIDEVIEHQQVSNN